MQVHSPILGYLILMPNLDGHYAQLETELMHNPLRTSCAFWGGIYIRLVRQLLKSLGFQNL